MQDTTLGKIIISLLLLIAVSILMFSDFGKSHQVLVYDCGMAEWHPDIPKEIREECRKLKFEEHKEKIHNTNETKNSQYI